MPDAAKPCRPRAGDRVQVEITSAHPVYRPGTRHELVTGDVVPWNDHMVHLHQAGDVQPVCLEQDIEPPPEAVALSAEGSAAEPPAGGSE